MRMAAALGIVLTSVASVGAQDYQSPVPKLPQGLGLDTSAAQPLQTALPPANTTATAQTPAQTATSPPVSVQQK